MRAALKQSNKKNFLKYVLPYIVEAAFGNNFEKLFDLRNS